MAGNDEPFERRYETRAYTNQTVPNATTSGVMPGHQPDYLGAPSPPIIDDQRAVCGWSQELRNAGRRAGTTRPPATRLRRAVRSRACSTRRRRASSSCGCPMWGGSDRTESISRNSSKRRPRLQQSQQLPAGAKRTHRNDGNYHRIRELRGNALRHAGGGSVVQGRWRQQSFARWNRSRRWSYIGTGPLAPDSGLIMFDRVKTGRQIPHWQADTFIKGGNPVTPALWNEDLYFHESTKFTGTSRVMETVSSGFVMAQGRLGREGFLGRTGYLTGVRSEKTEMEGAGWVRARIASATALRLADPAGAARSDYANTHREITGSYTKSFPSVHLTHEVTSNLKARLSWSTNFGRP